MELQFHKKSLSCVENVLEATRELEQTLELRLTSDQPEIGNVIGAWGQVLIRGKDWGADRIGVSGGITVWVLYAPAEGGKSQCLEGWLPFQTQWEIPQTRFDGTVRVIPTLRFVDARSISDRKIMVRAGVCLQVQACIRGNCDLYEPSEVPGDVQMKQVSYPLCMAVEAGEKSFSLEEVLEGSEERKTQRVIACSIIPTVNEEKVIAGRVVFRGDARVTALCQDGEGGLWQLDTKIPFSQFAQLEGEYSEGARANVQMVVTSLSIEPEPAGLRLKAGLVGQYTIYDTTLVTLMEDAYSPRRQIVPQLESLDLPVILEMEQHRHSARIQLPEECSGVQYVGFCPEPVQVLREGEGLCANLGGNFCVIYYDALEELRCSSIHWQDQLDIEAGGSVKMDSVLRWTGSQIGVGEVWADLVLETVAKADEDLETVSALEMGDLREPDPTRPSLILRKCGGESLWDVAKACGSTEDAIRKANGLESDPEPGRFLLIPVS